MRLEYEIREENLISSHVYYGLRTKRSKIYKFLSLYIFPAYMSFMGYQIYMREGLTLPFTLIIIAILFPPVYQLFLKKPRFKRYFKKYVNDKYSFLIGKTEVLEIDGSIITVSNPMGDSKLNLEGIELVNEVSEFHFIKLRNQSQIVLPKDQLNELEVNNFIEKILEKVEIPVTQDLKWKL